MTAKKLIIILLSVLITLIVIRTIINLSQPPKSSEPSPEVQAAMEEMEKLKAEQEKSAVKTGLEEPEAEPEVKPEEVAEEPQSAEPNFNGMTMSQQNAVKKAMQYLDFSAFSRQGLIDQLSSEYGSGFPIEDAEFAVAYLEDNEMVDWNEQAVKKAQEYLNFTSFSRDGLIDQLSSEHGSQFTREQAEYAASQVGY